MTSPHPMPLADRIAVTNNPCGKKIMQTMLDKKSRLAVSADVTDAESLLRLTEKVAEHICILKTHIDIIKDFSPELIVELLEMQEKYNFVIFEDRKFADIGNTVEMQYGEGIYNIADWADVVNAHIIPGPGIIEGLRKVGLDKQRGLLLLAQMSSQGSLASDGYTNTAVNWAEQYSDFVCGFIAQQRLSDNPSLLTLTPGISQQGGAGSLQQRYRTAQQALASGSDIIIVGRDIYKSKDPAAAAHDFSLVF